jgi:hypothetical protein
MWKEMLTRTSRHRNYLGLNEHIGGVRNLLKPRQWAEGVERESSEILDNKRSTPKI